ncbi:TlpA disulfide reductase family protein [Fulvivirgaceae bacterium BMA10]|uniref:TlpA disulfide reductase family protein n=1 Tax=Splendidivirga corallicola TaxID=3051826 RepID=A0ABT8KL78_9BACT|nr:TlpA disulfide reductase family protein [Fulvivirgaceae bacterium BMA10]
MELKKIIIQRISGLLCLTILTLFCLSACQNNSRSEADENQTNYHIAGQVEQFPDSAEVYLYAFDPIKQISTPIDTSQIDDKGKYQLSYEFSEPSLLKLRFFGEQTVYIVVDEGQNDVTLNVEGKRKGSALVKGSPDSEKLLAYEKFRVASYNQWVRPTYDSMDAATERGDTQAEIEAVHQYTINNEIHRKELIDFTKKEIGTSIALYGTMLRWTGDDKIGELEALVSAFKAEHPSLTMTSHMQDKVSRFKKVAIGVQAPPLAQSDTAGNMVDLADINAKVILIDFWASWCGPCILQIPDLNEAYDKYHEKGFEIVSVSVDHNGDKWKRAIRKYEMPWIHMSDLKEWESDAAKNYNVTFVPFNFLLDGEGKILAKNLHSKALSDKLEELLVSN